ncbi:MAG: hypothetical protein GY805_17375 [Chloroflexi bacterium]|nr:hypothetical protein [Chloroflexota bacterium]
MPRKKQSRGNCAFCGREMTRDGLSKHLRSCTKRQETIAAAQLYTTQTLYHLLVRDAYDSDFWLHLEVNGRSTLTRLDRYLRAIWLECCGHMSQFSVGGWRGQEIGKSRKIEGAFASGVELTHIYDFGTSSETLIKPVATRTGKPLSKHPVYLMARNKLPDVVCDECDAAASFYCVDCLVEQGEWISLCDKHRAEHDHDEYGGPSPLINSPRLGMCGYDGPAEPPY